MEEKDVLKILEGVVDPELNRNIVELNMIRDIVFNDDKISLKFLLTTESCPLKDELKNNIVQALKKNGFKEVQINLETMKNDDLKKISSSLKKEKSNKEKIRNIIAVASGKGGVGKSTITSNLAASFKKIGYSVGILDADINGPNIPMMFGIKERPEAIDEMILPIEKYGIKIVSLGFLMEEESNAILWRGPLISKAITELFEYSLWGELDFLLVDLPPGTGDETLTVGQSLPLDGVLIVTTPQDVSVVDAKRSAYAFNKLNVKILGVVENMSYFICPENEKEYDIFGSGGGEKISKYLNIPLLGKIPIEIEIRKGGDIGEPIVFLNQDLKSSVEFINIAEKIAKVLNVS
ncbi:MAG TPA: Mrp/NBP35 family ATP-binding protein [Caldisericia bacterium]|nr:Mrp/NBP35 family ATP-binding protein [Caldisericia bacterium]HOL83244.1 Mrp/NBP35 family ATP-binding protein [Caldisericia bacterium]